MMKITKGRLSLSGLKRIAIFLFLLASPLISLGQADEGCGGQDPYDIACPLDSWVFLLVIIAGLFAVFYLKRKGQAAVGYNGIINVNKN